MAGLRHFQRWRSARLARCRRLFCELLEDRRVLSTFVVDSVDDEPDRTPGDGQALTISGTVTLRAAIMEANATAAQDTILFNIPGSGPHVIQPTEALPNLTQPIVIDGYLNNPGASPNTNPFALGSNARLNIVLDGTLAPNGTNGLTIEGGSSLVRGLVIRYFRYDPSTGLDGFGIALGVKGGNRVEGNFIGTDVDGMTSNPNTSGIALASDSNTVGGLLDADRNVISGNLFNGIQVGSVEGGISTGATGNVIQGNYVGTTAAGDAPLPNDNGIRISFGAGGTKIGGPIAGNGNVLSGNRYQGVFVDRDSRGDNVVEGNFIGTDATGNITDADGIPGSGDELGNGDDGIDIETAGNTVGGPAPEFGNVISGNRRAGVLVHGQTATNNVVQNNRIGTNASGTEASIAAHMGNGGDGVQLYDAPVNAVEDNLIANNKWNGVGIVGAAAVGNSVQGNLIGMDVSGTTAIGNRSGISISDASSNVIGGIRPNVVSGNKLHGIMISGAKAQHNLIKRNLIGTDITGLTKMENQLDGVLIVDASLNVVGGTTPDEQNLISGNERHGVHISGASASGNSVRGNLIGTDLTGMRALGNQQSGVAISSAPGNIVGGEVFAAGNVISGNAVGVQLDGHQASRNVVAANLIGTTRNGKAPLPNIRGVYVTGAHDNTIGGSAVEAGNVISGNSLVGVEIVGPTATRNRLSGNYIGTDLSGQLPLPNDDGVFVGEASGNWIGGSGLSEGNTISANKRWGVTLEGAAATDNVVAGNLIGTNASSATTLGNGMGGVLIQDAMGNTIGGVVAGAGNVISGSGAGSGVEIRGAGAIGNLLAGNLIGTNIVGSVPIPNLRGVLVAGGAGNTVGGRSTGSRNVISGNLLVGVEIIATGTIVEGNYIGTDRTGQSALANEMGVFVGGPTNFIGGGSGGGNVISGNTDIGIKIEGPLAHGNVVQHNFIGTNAAGNAAVPNDSGVFLENADDNLIGGSAGGNLISGNGTGVDIKAGRINRLLGNRIGTDQLGLGAVGNGIGVLLRLGATSNTIGGPNVTDRNLISGNSGSGVSINAANRNVIAGNYIGTQSDGLKPLGNGGDGVSISLASNNILGGSAPGEGNVIAHNAKDGVTVESGTGNTIARNSFFDNVGLGIDLGDDGITFNDVGDVDTGANQLQNDPSLMRAVASATATHVSGTLYSLPTKLFTIEVFVSATGGLAGFGTQGSTFLDARTSLTDSTGRLAFTFAQLPPLPVGSWITATATAPDGSTSEFSRSIRIEADSDSDGVGDDEEDNGPHGGDGNQDGLPDSQQRDVATLINAVNGAYATLVAGVGSALKAVASLANPAPQTSPPGLAFNQGFFSFGVELPAPGTATTVSIIPSSFSPITSYYKYGPTPDNPSDHWYDFTFSSGLGAEILSDRIVLHLVDGERGDSDLVADGQIADPGGSATLVAPGLHISGEAGPAPAFVGQTLGYWLTVTNHSSDATDDVSIIDKLPRGAHFLSASASNGALLTQSAGIITGTLGRLDSGQSVIVSITTVLTEPGEMLNTATVSGGGEDLDLSDNSVNVVTNVSPAPTTIRNETDLAIDLTATPGPVGVGGDLTYSYTVTNYGPDTANGVVLTDTLPADVQLVAVNASRTVSPPANTPLQIRFDYSYDVGYYDPNTWEYFPPFFEDQERRDLLELAAGLLLSDVRDDLDAIATSGDNHWVATFTDPSTGSVLEVPDLFVAENELVIFVGSRDLGMIGLENMEGGEGGPGGLRAAGTHEFITAVQTRGERGARVESLTDFGPWGGSIAFNANPTAKYHFGETLLGLDADELDFMTVAMHELAHVLGIGTSPSWVRNVDPMSDTFVGLAARVEYDLGGDVPLNATREHWLDGTTDGGDATLMDPVIATGMREWPTPLDLAALRDVGWGDEPQSMSVPIPYSLNSGVLSFDVGALDAGQSVTLTVVVTPVQDGTAVDNVTVSGAGVDLDDSNNSAQSTTQVAPCPPLVVNTTWDIDDRISDGRVTSLREAIRLANLLPGKDTISFDLPATGTSHWIDIRSALPTITDPVVIDGTTQPDYAGTPVVNIIGRFYRSGPNGLHIIAGDSTIRGLGISLYHEDYIPGSITQDNAILLEAGDGNIIEGNLLGSYESSAGIMLIHSDGNRIGGTTEEARNVIAGNYGWGIFAYDSDNNLIQGNYIGTDASGQLANYGNGTGITLALSDHNRIGGTEPGAGNVISGNRGVGVEVSAETLFTNANSNSIVGNFIGVAADGSTSLGNGSHGVAIWLSNQSNYVGGREAGAGNVIAHNGGAGVLYGGTNAHTQIVGNSIFSNGGLAIDRLPIGVTRNSDFAWYRATPNYPDLLSAVFDPGATRVRGTLQALPNTTCQLDFYASATNDPTGHGEGQMYLGTASVTSDQLGNAAFFVSLPQGAPAGWFVAATSTVDVTSEFSESVRVQSDRDRDGVPDSEEDGGPNFGDSNQDGSADSYQADVATFRDAESETYLTWQSPAGTRLHGMRAIDNPAAGSSPYATSFPLGFVEGFVEDVAPGGAVSVTAFLPSGFVADSYYQYGQLAGMSHDTWYSFAYDGETGAEVMADRIVLHYVDGGRGDHDQTVDGRISFLGGITEPVAMFVLDVDPEPNQLGVPVDTAISVTFGANVDTSSVSDQTLFAHGSQSGKLLVPPNALTVDRATVTLDGTKPFHPGELVEVTATQGVTSVNGETPVAPRVWQFRASVDAGTGVYAESSQRFGYPDTYGVAMEDFNGDGNVDVFFANANAEPCSLLLNDGQGWFSDSGQRLGPVEARDVAAGDLDADGDLDVWVATLGEGNRVWLNDGHGMFSDSGQRLGVAATWGVRLGDLDGDGDVDAFTANGDGQANTIWLNDGQAHFIAAGLGLGAADSRDAALGDLDGDGDLDAFVANLDGGNEVWLNDGLSQWSDSGQRLGTAGNRAVALGDLDGDGDLDAYSASAHWDTVWFNDGHGQFTASPQYLQSDGMTISLNDFDGDGDLDALALVNSAASTRNYGDLWLNDGHGWFQRSGLGADYIGAATTTGGQAIGDVDGDGDSDVILANLNPGWFGQTILFENKGDGTIGTSTSFPSYLTASAQEDLWNASMADLDGDTDLDVFLGGRRSEVWLNDGEGRYHFSGQQLGPARATLGDLDGDGDIDVLATYSIQPGYPDQSVQVMLNDGTGHFVVAQDIQLSSTFLIMCLGDLDGDGDLDTILSRMGWHATRNEVWLNDGNGLFSNSGRTLGTLLDGTADIELGDVDGDGDLDAFLANSEGSLSDDMKNTVWLNDGSGNFSDSGQRLGRSYELCDRVKFGDLDADGDLDALIATNRYVWNYWTGWTNANPHYEIWLNDGRGHFLDSGQRLAAGRNASAPPGRAELGDLDGDGDLDIFAGDRVWLNDGLADFAHTNQKLGEWVFEWWFAYQPRESSVGDVDGDGDLDAIVLYNHRPVLWLNEEPDQVNHAPLAADDGYMVDQGTSLVVSSAGVLENDSDTDDEPLSTTLLDGPVHAAFFDFRADGSFTYTPRPDFAGLDHFVYQARDPHGLTSTATVSLLIMPGAPAPVAHDDFAATPQGVPVEIDLLANDSDRSGFVDPATITFLTEPTLGQVRLDLDSGLVSYEPLSGWAGTDQFIYRISGPTGLTDTAIVTVEILSGNMPPVAANDVAITEEQLPVDVDVLANDLDPDGNLDRSSVRIYMQPAHGTATAGLSQGAIRYVPDAGFAGHDIFAYDVFDTSGAGTRAVVEVTVLSVPDPPQANDDVSTTPINTSVVIPVLANDVDSDLDLLPDTLRVSSEPRQGQVTVEGTTGRLKYQPDWNFTGSDWFTYEICDGSGLCGTATVNVHVTNRSPVAGDDDVITQEDVPIVIDLTSNDFDPDGNLEPLSVRMVVEPLGASVLIDPHTGLAHYSPLRDFSGDDLFVYEISDSTGTLGPPAIALTRVRVTPVNDPPLAQNDQAVTYVGSPVTVRITANDRDVDSAIDLSTVTIESGPSSGSIIVEPDGSVTYSPDDGFLGSDQFRYTVLDETGGRSNVGVVTITVQMEPEKLLVGRIFEDQDGDGPELAGPGMAGVSVFLLDGQGQLLATVETQADDPLTPSDETGWYYFPDLATGTYVVAEQVLAGWRQSHPYDSGIPLYDPRMSSGVYVVTLSDTNRLAELDFGNYQPSPTGTASISGRVYVDVDNDGECDPPEIRLPNVPITIEGPVKRVVYTDANGVYRANDLPAGLYAIAETQPNVFNDGRETVGTPQLGRVGNDCFLDVELLPGTVADGYDFGEYGLKVQFISKYLLLASTPPAHVYIAQLQVSQGESLISFTAPRDGTLRLAASSEGETQPLQLYDNQWRPLALSTDSEVLYAPVTTNGQYLVYLAAANTTLITAVLDSEQAGSPVYFYSNAEQPLDVTADGYVTPRDALVVINSLNDFGARRLAGVNLTPYYVDVNGDTYLSPIDALRIINWLNRRQAEGECGDTADVAEGELDSYAEFAVESATLPKRISLVAEREARFAPDPAAVVTQRTDAAGSCVASGEPLLTGDAQGTLHDRLRDEALWEYLDECESANQTSPDELLDMLSDERWTVWGRRHAIVNDAEKSSRPSCG